MQTWAGGDFLICTFLPAVSFLSILDPTNPSILWKTFCQKCSQNSGGTERLLISLKYMLVNLLGFFFFLTVNVAIYFGGSSIFFHLCSDQSPRIGIYGQNGLKLNWKTNFFFNPSTGLSNESERLNLGNSFSKILCDYIETLKPCRKMCILVPCGKIL